MWLNSLGGTVEWWYYFFFFLIYFFPTGETYSRVCSCITMVMNIMLFDLPSISLAIVWTSPYCTLIILHLGFPHNC